MSKDVTIKVKINTGDGVKNVDELNNELVGTVTTIKSLEEEFERLSNEISTAEVGSDKFKKLQGELKAVDSELKNTKKSVEGLDFEGKAGEIGKFAGGIGAVGTAAALAFGDNKDIEKFFKTFATGIAITNGIKGAMEAAAAAQRLFNVASLKSGLLQVKNIALTVAETAVKVASAVATAAVTAAQWLWNAAITANPIGLIVVAIGAMVAGIIALGKWIYNNIETVKEWSKYLLLLLGPLGMIALAYIEITAEERKQADQLKKNAKKERDIAKQKIKDIKKVRAEENKAHKLRQTAFDLEIDTLEAAGKSSYAVRLGKLEDILAEEKARLAANKKIVEAEFTKYENIAKLQGKSLKDLATANGVNLEKVQKQIDASYLKQEQSIQRAENSITRLKREENEKRTTNDKETSDERIEIIKDELGEIKKLRETNAKDIVLVNEAMNNQLATDNNLTYEEFKALQDKEKQERLENQQFLLEQAIRTTELINDATSEIQQRRSEERLSKIQQAYDAEQEALTSQLANKEITQRQFDAKSRLAEQKRNQLELIEKRKAFKQQKALALSDIAIKLASTIAGIQLNAAANPTNAITFGAAGISQAAILTGMAVATSGVQAALVSSQKFRAAKGGVVPGSPSMIDSVDALLAPGEMVINSQSSQMFPQLLSQINQAGGGISLAPDLPVTQGGGSSATFRENEAQPTIKAIVVESDITDSQKKVSRMEKAASFG